MRRRPVVSTMMRIDEDLYRRVQAEAAKRRTTINAAVHWLVEQGLEQLEKRSHADLIEDQEIVWARYGERFLARELDESILTAIENRDFELAVQLAVTLRRTQEAAARRRADLMQKRQTATGDKQ